MVSKNLAEYKVYIGSEQVSNRFLFHAEDSVPLLRAVFERKVPMFSDAYSILANTMERMFKGVAIELQKLYPENHIVFGDIDRNHQFKQYAQVVNKYIPIAKSREKYHIALDNITRIAEGYTNSKFYDIYEYSDFERDYRRLEIYRERLYKGLEQELIKSRYRDVMEAEEAGYSREDLDLI